MKSPQLKLVALLATLALVLAAGAGPASAAPKEVAYGCGLDICLIDPDNPGAVVNLSDNEDQSIEQKPVWSPDGSKLAFVSNFSDSTWNVFVMNPDAEGQGINLALPVTQYKDGGLVQNLAWSPDGTKIAFQRGVSASTYSVHVAAANGTTAIPLQIAEHGQHPSWAADNGKIAYSYGEQVYLRNADASAPASPLPNGGGHDPAWSPGGTWIAFDGINPVQKDPYVDLHIVNSTGGGTPVVVPNNYSQWTFATWAPGGSKIVYRSTQGGGYGYLRVVDPFGGGDHALAAIANVNANTQASWSPDGSRVVVNGFGGAASTNSLYLVNTDGSGTMKPLVGVAYGNPPAWRPNPLITPFVPVVTPSGGSSAPLPATKAPKFVWITKRIPWTGGYVQPLIVFCAAKDCGVNSKATAKASRAAGLRFRPGPASPSAKPKTAVVASAKMKVPAGKRKPVKLKLNKQGVALIRATGELKMKVTVTISSPGEKKIVKRKTVRLYIPKKK